MERLVATLVSWLIGMPIYLPWLLARFGYYKKWYFTPFIPPFLWRGNIQAWPISAFFIFLPIVGLSPLSDDLFMKAIALISIGGILFALILMAWTPGWAKSSWQRRLENLFSHEQISAFIVTWRKMSFSTWCEMIDTEEGMLELVDYALENHTQHVDHMVTLRMEQLDNAKKRRLKQKPKWLFQDED